MKFLPNPLIDSSIIWEIVVLSLNNESYTAKGPFTHKTEGPWPLQYKHSLVVKAEAVQVRFTIHLMDQHSKWMQYGYNVYMDLYTASNGSCFMVTHAVFKNLLLKACLTQNQEIIALLMPIPVDLFHFIMCEDPRE